MDPSPPSGPTNSPESTLSSDSSSDRIAKKTRDLPNLSDCHSCGHRINYSNPKERLQPMDSMWRIVLLCKKCSKKVKSSDLCPYCFSCTSGGDDCFKCRDCDRCIHRDCVGKYGGIAPWSYSCSGLGFSICIDCWVPDSLVSSIRVYKRKSRKKRRDKNNSVGSDTAAPDNKKLEEAVKDANMLVERKVANAVRAKENAVRKAVVAKSAVELATGAVNFVYREGEKGKCNGGGRDNKVVGDAELAIMLHRAMNSSARISRNKHLVSASRLVVLDCGDELTGAISENLERTVLGTSVCFKTSDCGSFVDLSVGMMNGNTSSSGNECQASGEGRCEGNTDRYLLKYRRIDKSVTKPSLLSKASDCGPCRDPDDLNNGTVTDTTAPLNYNRWLGNGEQQCSEKRDRYLLKYTRSCLNGNKCQKNAEERCDEKPDRYFLKYTRTCLNGDGCLGNGEGRCNEKSDRYLLKYRRNYQKIRCQVNQGGCSEKPDRYFLKYTRTYLNRNHSQGNGEVSCNEKPDRYSLKYAKRSKSADPALNCETKPLYDSFCPGNQNSTPL